MQEFDSRVCVLGEGTLWHPKRKELFWFDIDGKRLLSRNPDSGATREVALHEVCSAAGWVDAERLVIASETGFWLFDIEQERFTRLASVEADSAHTRSNDGRVDPWGGFWLGTMGKDEEPGAGALYRFYRGEVRQLFANLTITNSICFAPDRSSAYFSDTSCAQLYRVALDSEGWPASSPEILVDFEPFELFPDGAVTMADGSLRVSLWGAGAVIEVSSEGRLGDRLEVGAPHATCPAFGGENFTTLYVSTAIKAMSPQALQEAPQSGMTFSMEEAGQGKPEPAFDLTGIEITGVAQ